MCGVLCVCERVSGCEGGMERTLRGCSGAVGGTGVGTSMVYHLTPTTDMCVCVKVVINVFTFTPLMRVHLLH